MGVADAEFDAFAYALTDSEPSRRLDEHGALIETESITAEVGPS